MTKTKKTLIPITILVLSIAAVFFITSNPPQARKRPPATQAQVVVEVSNIVPKEYGLMLSSYGTVVPRTQSLLMAQVGGQIIKVSEQYRDGGFFEKDEPLVWLDDRDLVADARIAETNVLSARQLLLEEEAQSEQAQINWQRLGNGTQPNDLVLRKPQLEAAKANLLSAQAQFQKAELSLERTIIKAPYAGRILSTNTDLGQVINSGSELASIYAIDVVEVRLPINNNDLAFMDLPIQYRGNNSVNPNTKVFLRSDLIGQQNWLAKIVRTEGSIDIDTQQLYVVAQIEDPFDMISQSSMPIKIGQYVEADIEGKRLNNAIVIPNDAIYQGSYVYIVENDVLLRKEISIKWQNSKEAIIASGLKPNDKLVITPMGQVSSGTAVQILETQTKDKGSVIANPRNGKERRKGNRKKAKEAS